MNIESWFGLTIENDGTSDTITIALTDLDSSDSASAYFDKTRFAKKAIPEVVASHGGSSYYVEMNFLATPIKMVTRIGQDKRNSPTNTFHASISKVACSSANPTMVSKIIRPAVRLFRLRTNLMI